jgi:hypothetical protein
MPGVVVMPGDSLGFLWLNKGLRALGTLFAGPSISGRPSPCVCREITVMEVNPPDRAHRRCRGMRPEANSAATASILFRLRWDRDCAG